MKKNSQFPIPNSKLSKEVVKHVAKLANLELNCEEIKKFQHQLSEILNYVRQLEEVNTDKIEPTSQVTGLENVFREDKIFPSLKTEEVLFSAPKKFKNYFKTKVILEK